jgi:hypothetical protein
MKINEITTPSREQQVEEAYLYLGRMIEYVENDPTLFESQKQQLNEAIPLLLAATLLGTGVGTAATGYDLYQSHNEYKRMKREAGDDPAALEKAEEYWDQVKGDAAVEAAIVAAGSALTGGTFGAVVGGMKAARGVKKLAKQNPGIIQKAKDAIGKLFNRSPKELNDLKNKINDTDFQQQLQKVQQKMANDPTGKTTPTLRANPADRIPVSGANASKPSVAGGAGKGAVKGVAAKSAVGAAAGPAILGPSKKSEVDNFNQNPYGDDKEDTENRLKTPTTPTPAPTRISR